ncbi:MAG TPA: PAS domain S-box protein [bacterium]|nr:PAS domain S-box protein [bacterium]
MSDEKPKTILLVEDEIVIATDEKLTLEKYGYAVRIVSSGEEALNAVRNTHGIDMVLMDINLGGGIDGTQAARRILDLKDIPLIFLSSHVERETVEKTEGITSYGYIVKNSGEMVLVASIKMAFRLFEARKKEKEKEEALRRSEEDYRRLFEDHSAVKLVIDPETGHIIDANHAAAQYYGWPRDVLKTMKIQQINTLSDEAIRKEMRTAKERSRTFFEFRHRRADGSIRNVSVFSCGIRLAGRDCVHSIVIDITDRKQAEKALRDSQAFLTAVYESIQDGISVLNTDLTIRYTNPVMKKWYAPSLPLEGKKCFTAYHHTDSPCEVCPSLRCIRSGKVESDIVPGLPGPDSPVKWLELFAYPVRDSITGKITRVVEFVRDITDRVEAEKALWESRERLNLAVKSAGIGLWDQDYTESIITRNPEWSEMLGYDPEEIESNLNIFLDLVHPDDLPELQKRIQDHEQGKTDSFHVEHRMRTKRKDWKWILNSGKIVARDANGKPLRAAGVHINIHDRRQAEEEVKRQLAEKETLLKEVHHRIKNNIASLESLLSLHMRSIRNQEALSILQDAAGRIRSMRALYDRLLLATDYQDVSVKAYLESLIDTVVTIFPNRVPVRLEKRIDDFTLDSKQLFPLGIILNELLTNIMKHAFADSKKGRIQIALRKKQDRVTLTVHDNGKGLPEGFDPSESGGFGLRLVRMLNRQLEGTFSMSSRNGTRSTLEFTM